MFLNEKEILERYSFYIDEMKKIGEFPIWKNVRIDDLKPSRGVVQRAYKEIRDIKKDCGGDDELAFKGNLIDYICWISMIIIIFFPWQGINMEEKFKDRKKRAVKKNINIFTRMFPAHMKNALRLYLKSNTYLDKAIEVCCHNLPTEIKSFLFEEMSKRFSDITPKDVL